jgi:hypothetical protein
MIMANPVPYDQANLNNSPLEASGYNFPCKAPSYQVTKMNNMKVGEQQTLSFTGSATHSGGSCQLSVTLDKQPMKNSVFRAIYSIEGGCPGAGAGNSGPTTFPFRIPAEVPNGEATLAWTWFNKLGNREFYMNCAPITVTGGASNNSAFDKLPDMAVANIEGSQCKTREGFDYIFENPGQYVTKGGTGPYAKLCGGAASPGDIGAPNQSVSNPGIPTVNPGIPPANPSSSAPVAPPAPPMSSPSVPAVSAPVASSKTTSAFTTFLTITESPSAPAAIPSAPAAPSSPPSTGGGGGGTCSSYGAILCNGEDQFGICSFGKVIWQPVAAGTKCQDGKFAQRFAHRAQRSD